MDSQHYAGNPFILKSNISLISTPQTEMSPDAHYQLPS